MNGVEAQNPNEALNLQIVQQRQRARPPTWDHRRWIPRPLAYRKQGQHWLAPHMILVWWFQSLLQEALSSMTSQCDCTMGGLSRFFPWPVPLPNHFPPKDEEAGEYIFWIYMPMPWPLLPFGEREEFVLESKMFQTFQPHCGSRKKTSTLSILFS